MHTFKSENRKRTRTSKNEDKIKKEGEKNETKEERRRCEGAEEIRGGNETVRRERMQAEERRKQQNKG